MKKRILFALIGGVVIFAWQFLSFAMPNFHKSAMEYTPLQGEILDAIEAAGLEEGMYTLGQPDPTLDKEAYNKAMEEFEGKPWGVLNYQMDNSSAMGLNMVRGLIMTIIVCFIFFWVISQQKNPTLMNRILVGVAIGFIGFATLPYSNFIWFKEPDIWAYLLDAFVPWIIVGWIGHKMAK